MVIDSQKTAVRLGVVIAITGFLASAVWWAATLTAKVDTLLANSQAQIQAMNAIEKRMTAAELRLAVLESKTNF